MYTLLKLTRPCNNPHNPIAVLTSTPQRPGDHHD